MKTRSHLLLLALVLVLIVVCFAACNNTDPEPQETTASTTTTASGATTTAPVTTPPPGALHPHAQGIEVVISGASYSGKELQSGYTVNNLKYKVSAVWSFQQIDPTSGEPLSGVAPVSKPKEVGTYEATVSFVLYDGATAEDLLYTLPEPVSGRYVVEKKTIGDSELTVSAQGFNTFWYDDMALELADANRVAKGTLPNYLERVYTVYKVDDRTVKILSS